MSNEATEREAWRQLDATLPCEHLPGTTAPAACIECILARDQRIRDDCAIEWIDKVATYVVDNPRTVAELGKLRDGIAEKIRSAKG